MQRFLWIPCLALFCAGGWLANITDAGDKKSEDGYVPLFNGKDLTGWHISAMTGHSSKSKNKTGGKWVVTDGVITGTQDEPGNGGIILTDKKYKNFEVVLEMKNDFGLDSGLFLRSTEDGKAYQAMIDYYQGGNLMGIYGEGIGAFHYRNYSFLTSRTKSPTTSREKTRDRLLCPSPPRNGQRFGSTANGTN